MTNNEERFEATTPNFRTEAAKKLAELFPTSTTRIMICISKHRVIAYRDEIEREKHEHQKDC